MLKTKDMLLRLITLKESAGQLDAEYANYLMSLMDLYMAVGRISMEDYQEFYVKLDFIINPIVEEQPELPATEDQETAVV